MIWGVQLVFDCADPDAITQFWGQALQYSGELIGAPAEQIRAFREANPQYDGRGRIDDGEGRRTPVYIQRVPEAKVGRNRLRPEVAVSARAVDATSRELEALGASRAGAELADVEGNEFTIEVDAEPRDVARRLRSIVFDCVDPDRMLAFWSEALGYVVSPGRCDPAPGSAHIEEGWIVIAGERVLHRPFLTVISPPYAALDLTPGLAFVPADRPKTLKNRLHLDLRSTDAEGDLERLRRLGATVQRWDTDHVLEDPEGNELCLG